MQPLAKNLNLVVLAAGIGRRFGGVKQLSRVGPADETIIDYSLYDALRAGFERVVFIIRRAIEADFREVVGRFWEGLTEVDYAFQELNLALPAGYSVPASRNKPWGTGHALLMVESKINGPFLVINADDFYGRQSFEVMARFLRQVKLDADLKNPGMKPEYALAGYRLEQTLSFHGSVCRGICRVEAEEVVDIKEMKHIERTATGARARLEDGRWVELPPETVVSMNFWGFEPSLFPLLRAGFEAFLKVSSHDPQAEFLIPEFIGELVRSGKARVRALPTTEKWFGITYPEDLADVRMGIRSLVEAGLYPADLKASLLASRK